MTQDYINDYLIIFFKLFAFSLIREQITDKRGNMEKLKGKKLKLREHITLVSIEDMAVLLDVERKCYYDLNDSAFLLLNLMEDGCLYMDMKAELVSDFNVADINAQQDLDRFIGLLLRRGLVEIIENGVACEGTNNAYRSKKDYQPPLIVEEAEIVIADAKPAVSF